MLNGNRKLRSLLTTNVCRRDGDVLLRTNTLEDELHTRVPLLLRTPYSNSTTIYVKSMGSSARICVPFTDVVQKMHFHIQQ